MKILPHDLNSPNKNYKIDNVLQGLEPFVIYELMRTITTQNTQYKDLLFVAKTSESLHSIERTLQYLLPEIDIVTLPPWDCMPYDIISPRKIISSTRNKALYTLQQKLTSNVNQPTIVLTTTSALLQKVPAINCLNIINLCLQITDMIPQQSIIDFLLNNGYHRVSNVHEPSEFAVRGDIIDIFIPSYQHPHRLNLFADKIEDIKEFDAFSQRSLQRKNTIEIITLDEVVLNKSSIALFKQRYGNLFPKGLSQDELYNSIVHNQHYRGMEHWLPLFYTEMGHITDYLQQPLVLFNQNFYPSYHHRLNKIQECYNERLSLHKNNNSPEGYNPIATNLMYTNLEQLTNTAQALRFIETSEFISDNNNTHTDYQEIPKLYNSEQKLQEFLSEQQGLQRSIHIFCTTDHKIGVIKRILTNYGIQFKLVNSYQQSTTLPIDIVRIHHSQLEKGFTTKHAVFITERDFFLPTIKSPKNKQSDLIMAESSDIQTDDLVVHRTHGIGKYEGLHHIKINDKIHDCIKLLYFGGDTIYVPVENIELVSRYGKHNENIKLDKLGNANWQERRAKVKKKLEDIAGRLIATNAKRQTTKTKLFHVEQKLYNKFTDSFPFVETEDQTRTIQDVISDLSSGNPMDRLICGDVGFGKTEVAMRAAFIAAMNGAQVALVCPTTLLARQHFNNFQNRFAEFGLTVEQLSRLVKTKRANEIKQELNSGSVDIIIGTHSVLAQNIKFKNLGLCIIDEEQHFGVKQKERLKEVKDGIHVLSLTATPIPRTLQLSLSGARDLSIIATPPIARLPVKTFVTKFDFVVVKEAIQRELARKGQIFYVCPKIKDLEHVLQNLLKINKTYKICMAHGQMPSTELEKIMDQFSSKKYDILLATNIIESGIDLPSVNTIFIHRADMFGLSQLYQLRGRIGRSKERGYAYLTIPDHATTSPQATKRLKAMQTLDTLGAGFKLASYDMDIRGAGNLLGQEQSGQIKEVGIELYQKMLGEAVAKIKKHDTPLVEEWSPQINLGIAVLIPENYIKDLAVRMSIYRRMARLTSQLEIDNISEELIDRFGQYPPEVANLLTITQLKQQARELYISKIDVGTKGVVVIFHAQHKMTPEKIINLTQQHGQTIQLYKENKILFRYQLNSDAEKISAAQHTITTITQLLESA